MNVNADYREPTSTVTLKKWETLRWTMTLEQKTTPAPLTEQGILRLVGPTPENQVYYSLLAVDNSNVILNNITIHSNHTVDLQTNFPPQHWGT